MNGMEQFNKGKVLTISVTLVHPFAGVRLVQSNMALFKESPLRRAGLNHLGRSCGGSSDKNRAVYTMTMRVYEQSF